MTESGTYPGDAPFAFTILDDTDDGTVANLQPLYDLLHDLGLRTTKTVWPLRHDGESNFFACETLEDEHYLAWVRDLQARGFEITWHCATFESSTRDRTIEGLDRLRATFGVSPRVHANHSWNRENLYWGEGRFDLPLIGRLWRAASRVPEGYFQGHVEGSPYWWGDLCQEHVVYARNLTFGRLNLARINPSMPYRDPKRPLVPYWFSTSDAPTVREFRALTAPEGIARLEAERGFTIVSTHLGKGFVRDGVVDPVVRRNLEYIAGRKGWFPTTGELLDWLGERGGKGPLPSAEWLRMQARFVLDLLRRKASGSKS